MSGYEWRRWDFRVEKINEVDKRKWKYYLMKGDIEMSDIMWWICSRRSPWYFDEPLVYFCMIDIVNLDKLKDFPCVLVYNVQNAYTWELKFHDCYLLDGNGIWNLLSDTITMIDFCIWLIKPKHHERIFKSWQTLVERSLL